MRLTRGFFGVALTVALLLVNSHLGFAQVNSQDCGKMTLKDLLAAPTAFKYEGAEMVLQAEASVIFTVGKNVIQTFLVTPTIVEKHNRRVPALVAPKFVWLVQKGKLLTMKDLRMANYQVDLPPYKKCIPAFLDPDVKPDLGKPLEVVLAIGTTSEEGLTFLKLSKPIQVKRELQY